MSEAELNQSNKQKYQHVMQIANKRPTKANKVKQEMIEEA